MKIKFRWRPAFAVPIPPIGALTAGLAIHRLVQGTALTLGLACLTGLLLLIALAVLAREETRRAALPYRAEQMLAKAEARNRARYAKAQTRRFNRIASREIYSPDMATDLIGVMAGFRSYSPEDGSVTRKSADPAPTRP
jgi:predicted lipid-binding transport protein (Tim44 family)